MPSDEALRNSPGERVLKGNFYPWQIEAWQAIAGQNAVLSAPTGSGKTLVAYLWAGLLDPQGRRLQVPPGEKVIFTAPIKALSNERYMELLDMGCDVGIETGDFKKNPGAPVICCTQEIYALKYAGTPGIKVVIDEFHYIFSENERSRAYIDGIRKTYPTVPILVMSATFGQPEHVKAYLERILGQPFRLYITDQRATELQYLDYPLAVRDIRDALVFAFSQKGALQLADMIAQERLDFDQSRKARLRDLAWILEVRHLRRSMFKGVAVYHGSLLPKEKLLVERAYRERIIDVVVGTDALALGVNLPAETVVFAQLVKFHDRRPISKIAFLQMAGRAGRKGLFDKGYVTWLQDSPAESRGVDTGRLFKVLCRQPVENARVELRPDFGAILKNRSTVENEAEIVAFGSLPQLNQSYVLEEIREALRQIDRSFDKIAPGRKEQFRAILADIWYSEMEVEQNLEMAELFFWGASQGDDYIHPDGLMAPDLLQNQERNFLQALLKVKRFNNSLPEVYRFRGMDRVDQAIMDIDPTVFGFEEKIHEMEHTKVPLPALQHRTVDRRRGGRKAKSKGQAKQKIQEKAKETKEKEFPPRDQRAAKKRRRPFRAPRTAKKRDG